MASIGTIIAENRKKKGMSQKDLVLALGEYGHSITYKAVSKWEQGSALPNVPVFLAVCKILEVTDIYEAFFGTNPFNPLSSLNEDGKKKAIDYIDVLAESDRYKKVDNIIPFKRSIRLFKLPASAGTGEFLDGDDFDLIEVGEEVPANADFGIRICGDSMEPRFINGQIVWIHQQDSLTHGDIGIFYLDGNAYCKKLQDNDQGLALISLNTKYEPIPVTENSSLKVFGKVVG